MEEREKEMWKFDDIIFFEKDWVVVDLFSSFEYMLMLGFILNFMVERERIEDYFWCMCEENLKVMMDKIVIEEKIRIVKMLDRYG